MTPTLTTTERNARMVLDTRDPLDLYATLAIAGRDIRAASDRIYLAYRMDGGGDDALARADARHAAERVLIALRAYEDQIEPMEMV
jgi:hypothetical protein